MSLPLDTGTQGTVFEFFPLGTSDDPDLDLQSLVFTPNGQGGWFVTSDLEEEVGTPGAVQGTGVCESTGNRVAVLLRASSLGRRTLGRITFSDPRGRFIFSATRLQSVQVFGGRRAVIIGTGFLNRTTNLRREVQRG